MIKMRYELSPLQVLIKSAYADHLRYLKGGILTLYLIYSPFSFERQIFVTNKKEELSKKL